MNKIEHGQPLFFFFFFFFVPKSQTGHLLYKIDAK